MKDEVVASFQDSLGEVTESVGFTHGYSHIVLSGLKYNN